MQSGNVFYFAYGSNLNPERMRRRLPFARAVGTATIRGWRLAERLYADIERAKGGRVHGVLFLLTPDELRTLDHYEGYPFVYRNALVKAHLDGAQTVRAITYVMTPATRKERAGRPYPEVYRRICSAGAQWWEIPDPFAREGDRPPRGLDAFGGLRRGTSRTGWL